MGEGVTSAVTIPISSSSSSAAARNSSSIRFLGLLKQPETPDSSPHSISALELDESDVIWSSSDDHSSASSTLSPVPASAFPLQRTSQSHTFIPATFGLSALLDSDKLTGPGVIWRQSSPITPPVAVPIARSSPPVRKSFNQSAPMVVPQWPARRRERREEAVEEIWGEEDEIGGNGEDTGEEEMEEIVPPHVIVARSHVSSFSVLEGVGRTLKGRDLRRVRNAVLQKTGFLDL